MRTKLTLTAAFVALTFGQAAFAANQNLSTDILVVGAPEFYRRITDNFKRALEHQRFSNFLIFSLLW